MRACVRAWADELGVTAALHVQVVALLNLSIAVYGAVFVLGVCGEWESGGVGGADGEGWRSSADCDLRTAAVGSEEVGTEGRRREVEDGCVGVAGVGRGCSAGRRVGVGWGRGGGEARGERKSEADDLPMLLHPSMVGEDGDEEEKGKEEENVEEKEEEKEEEERVVTVTTVT